jgi:hypothetical protein
MLRLILAASTFIRRLWLEIRLVINFCGHYRGHALGGVFLRCYLIALKMESELRFNKIALRLYCASFFNQPTLDNIRRLRLGSMRVEKPPRSPQLRVHQTASA